jgi:outer membrane lipoprotein-sorting protein
LKCYFLEEKEMKAASRRMAIFQTGISFSVLIIFLAISVFAQQEKVDKVVDRAARAHGNSWTNGKIVDWVATGKISITGDENGEQEFTLIVKPNDKIKRTIHRSDRSRIVCGSDGKKSWQIAGAFRGDATGTAAHFIESQTNRSITKLFDKNNTLKDLGTPDQNSVPRGKPSRIIEAKNEKGKLTRYHVDDATSLVTRMEFDTKATYRMLFGDKEYPVSATFVFSDYRTVNGIVTPFKIEFYQGMIKIEEMNFTSVKYNTGVDDAEFDF